MSETKRYQCRHIFTEGRRCGSPSLRHEDFCYYHHTTRRPAPDPRLRQNSDDRYAFDLPLPEDRAAIQLAIGHILLRIAHNQIDAKRAGLLLYGLQIASSNLPRQSHEDTHPPQVEEITTHPDLGHLAPPAEYDEATASGRPRSIMRQLIEDLTRNKPQAADEHTIPSLQAVAENPATHRCHRCKSVLSFLPTLPRLSTQIRSRSRYRPTLAILTLAYVKTHRPHHP